MLYLGYILLYNSYGASAKITFENALLQQLGCLNSSKRTKALTVTSIESLAGVLQPNLVQSEVVDEWKSFKLIMTYQTIDRQE